MPTIVNRNPDEISLANFTVLSGANALQRNPSPGGGIVENGALKLGKTVQTNSTNNTLTGAYFISQDPVEDLWGWDISKRRGEDRLSELGHAVE